MTLDTPQLTVADVTVNEAAGDAEVEVTLDKTVAGGFTVTAFLITEPPNRHCGRDYTAVDHN